MDRVITVVVCILILVGVSIMPGTKLEPNRDTKVIASVETEDIKSGDVLEGKSDAKIEEVFPGYEEKLSDDTVLDYRPGLAGDIAALPSVSSENFTEVTFEVIRLAGLASAQPGAWEDGNQPLGADAKQYVPSNEELIAAELGDRLFIYSESLTIDDIVQNAWRGSMTHPPSVVYKRFDFRHVDVMGSGRFFYSSEPESVVLDYGKRLKEEGEPF